MLETDPYAPPASRMEALPLPETEAARRLNLQREACAKGLSFVFFGIAVALLMSAALVGTSLTSASSTRDLSHLCHVAAALGLTVPALRIALGLRRLDRKARLWLAPVAAILLLLVPIGTIAAGWLFHQLLCSKASVIFSDDYHAIISHTGNVTPRLSFINLTVLALLLLFAGAAIFAYTRELV